MYLQLYCLVSDFHLVNLKISLVLGENVLIMIIKIFVQIFYVDYF